MIAAPGHGYATFDLPHLIEVLDFFHRSVTLSTMVVTISDYRDGSCVYVSPTFKDLSGHESEQLKAGGMNWLVHHLHPEDRSQYKINFTEGFIFLLNLPAAQRLRCYLNLSARLLHKKGGAIWIYQQCRPVALDDEGKPRYSLNVITDLSHLITDVVQPCWSVIQQETGSKPEFLAGSCGENLHWLFGSVASPLTRKETQVLQHLMKGLSGKQLAARMKISLNTVNTHRKNILKKARARNVSEAVTTAFNNDWIHE